MANRYSRVLLEESVKYGRQRRTFSRRLLDHQVLRHKIADMAGRVEAVHALLEQIAYQMKARVPDSRIGGITALAKVQATTTMEFCAREAAQIFGGNSECTLGCAGRSGGLTGKKRLHSRRPGGEGRAALPRGPRQRHRRRQRGDPPGPRDEAGQALSWRRRQLKILPFQKRYSVSAAASMHGFCRGQFKYEAVARMRTSRPLCSVTAKNSTAFPNRPAVSRPAWIST